jgi:nitrogen regulatory protein P-II 2
MNTVKVKLVTIIAEAVLKDYLLADLRALGASGYTLSRVEGEGSRGLRAGDLEGGNVKIETIVGDEVAEAILAHMAERYFAHYALIAFSETVEVVRGEKYV